ncbi:MAG: SUMF1/EgtB/PvdO family nonheme iron enzyme [Magnetococcales bacterium]|nr:SUMF1/EgtB/PvdO family nonheme iron enzyme [Magnetococcales bacterium]
MGDRGREVGERGLFARVRRWGRWWLLRVIAFFPVMLLLPLTVGAATSLVRVERNPEERNLEERNLEVQNLNDGFRALIIGVSDYLYWDKLPGVKEDGQAVYRSLKGLQRRGVGESASDGIRLLWDPGGRELVDSLERFAREEGSDERNRLFIYFAGHGERIEVQGRDFGRGEGEECPIPERLRQEGKPGVDSDLSGLGDASRPERTFEGYLVPRDAPLPAVDPMGFRRSGLCMSKIKEIFEKIRARHVIFLLDSCFSGSLFRSLWRGQPLAAKPAVGQFLAFPVRHFITAGAEDQRVPDQSYFRRFLQSGLAGAGDLDRDGYITGTELALFLRSRVAEASRGRQTPLYAKANEGEFLKGEFVFLSPVGSAGEKVALDPTFPVEAASRSPEGPRQPGKPFNDCHHDFCRELMVVPPGRFPMGSPRGEAGRDPDAEGEPVWLEIDHALGVGRREVTFAEWDECFHDGGCSRWPADEGWGRGGQPVIQVALKDVREYLDWLNLKSGRNPEDLFRYRLPSEAEWEYLARSGTVGARPWGEDIGVEQANCRGCGNPEGGRRTLPGGQFPANPFGLFDLLGNVWEWVDGCYGKEAGDSPLLRMTCRRQVIRGGSFATAPKGVRAAARGGYPPERKANNIGFRVVRTVPFTAAGVGGRRE